MKTVYSIVLFESATRIVVRLYGCRFTLRKIARVAA